MNIPGDVVHYEGDLFVLRKVTLGVGAGDCAEWPASARLCMRLCMCGDVEDLTSRDVRHVTVHPDSLLHSTAM